LFAPVPITPSAWTPPAAPGFTGQYERNTRLSPVDRLSLGEGHKPEDVALDASGRIYAGLEDGRIIQLQADGTQPTSLRTPRADRWEWFSIAMEI
jgi:hypothetical protein